MRLTEQQRKAKSQAKSYFFSNPVAMASAMNVVGAKAGAAVGARPNIVGVGIGPKVINGAIVADEAVRILVRVKIPKAQLGRDETVPAEFNKLPTDVVEVGEVRAFQTLRTWQRFGRQRPTSCGVSVGHPKITAGTLGCLVERGGDHYILSNNHVLADCNQANTGDDIIQPGALDGGSAPSDNIAVLSDYEPLDFSGNDNEIDAAIALVGPDTQTDVEPEIIDIGRPQRTTKPVALYQSVRKHGRTTGHTVGVVLTISTDLWVNYGVGQNAWFVDQDWDHGRRLQRFF